MSNPFEGNVEEVLFLRSHITSLLISHIKTPLQQEEIETALSSAVPSF